MRQEANEFIKSRPLSIVLISLSSVPVIIYSYLFIAAPEPVIISSVGDDAYFYFEIAQNIDQGFPTFDSIHPTTGYHPLYLILAIPIFNSFSELVLPIRIVGLLDSFFLFLTLIMGIIYLSRKHSIMSAGVFTAICLLFSPTLFALLLESAIVTPLALLLLISVERTTPWKVSETSRRKLFSLSILLTATHFARLDAILLTVPLTAFIMYIALDNGESINDLLLYLTTLPIISGLLYVFLNYKLTGVFRPTSNIAKSLTSPGVNDLLIAQIIRYAQAQRGLFLLNIPGYWDLRQGISLLMILFSSGYVIYYLYYKFGYYKKPTPNERITLITSLFVIFHIFYYLIFSSSTMPPWYWYSSVLAATIVLPQYIEFSWSILSRLTTDRSKKTLKIAIISILFIFPLIFGVVTVNQQMIPLTQSTEEAQSSSSYQSYKMAQFANDNLSNDAIFAMGDGAGAFGYYYKSPVIHLEGLVNSPTVFKYLTTNRLGEYMTLESVDYYAYEREVTYQNDTVITNPTDKITRTTTIRVHRYCEIYGNDVGKDHYIWKWPCEDQQS